MSEMSTPRTEKCDVPATWLDVAGNENSLDDPDREKEMAPRGEGHELLLA